MLLTGCRYLALLYAVGLAIGEAAINTSREHWQYAPLWIIDYVIVAYLLIGFWLTRRGRYVPILMSAYALSTGVLYIVVFLNLDPETADGLPSRHPVFLLMMLVLIVSVAGLIGTTLAWLAQESTGSASPP